MRNQSFVLAHSLRYFSVLHTRRFHHQPYVVGNDFPKPVVLHAVNYVHAFTL